MFHLKKCSVLEWARSLKFKHSGFSVYHSWYGMMANHISFHFMDFHGILQFVRLSCCSHLFWMFNLVSYSLLYKELKFISGIQFFYLLASLSANCGFHLMMLFYN